LVQRINRKLRREDEYGEGLQKTPKNNMQALLDLGDYYLLDLRRNFVVRCGVDIEKVGRKLGVLRRDEVIHRKEGCPNAIAVRKLGCGCLKAPSP
jgi:hypothetical protein